MIVDAVVSASDILTGNGPFFSRTRMLQVLDCGTEIDVRGEIGDSKVIAASGANQQVAVDQLKRRLNES